MMRNLPLVILLALPATFAALHASQESAQPLPTPFPQARYQQMSARSPFAVASASDAAPAATPGFAAQLYIDGVAHVGKTDYVAIKSRDTDNQKVMFLAVGQITDDGMKVERITWSDEMGKSTVDVSKAGEKATLVFDQAQMVAAPNNAPQPGQPVMGRPPMLPGRPNFQTQNGFGQRFFQQPGQVQGPTINLSPAVLNAQRRRVRGLIPSGQ